MTPGSFIVTVSATDLDSNYNGYVTYWMSATDGKFAIEADSGLVKLKAALDQSDNSEYITTIFARDHGIPANMAEAQLTIHVDNSNKHTPVFTQFLYSVSVHEDANVNDAVAEFTATDKDEGLAGEIQYEITRGNEDGIFSIQPTEGVLRLASSLDYEQKQNYLIEVTALDSGTPRKSATAILHVTVTDVDDNAPAFPSYPAEVYSAQVIPPDTLLFTFHAVDADSSMNGNNGVEYHFESGSDRYSQIL